MQLPKFYLIRSGLTEEQVIRLRAALDIAPPVGTFVFSPEDAEMAKQLADAPVVSADAPMAIVGKFDPLLTVVNDDGSLMVIVEG